MHFAAFMGLPDRVNLGLVALIVCLPACQHLVEPTDPSSPCTQLSRAYPGRFGLSLFTDDLTTSVSIPWCFPAVDGFGSIGYAVSVPVVRAGEFVLELSDIEPETRFRVGLAASSCAGRAIGATYYYLGAAARWSAEVSPGPYCVTLFKVDNRDRDVWFTLTLRRP